MAVGERLSRVIPSWREGDRLVDAVRAARGDRAEVVVAACEEPARVRAAAVREGASWIECERPGRGAQLAAGAAHATGDALVFLHADTRLPAGADAFVREALARPGVVGGAFRLRFDRAHPLLDRLAALSAIGHWSAMYGDQAMFCSRAAYERCGGFRALPMFEDVDLAGRLARTGRLVRVRAAVTTSARRFERHGAVRQFARNTALLAAFHAGVSPAWLARRYAPHHEAAGRSAES